VFIYKQKNALKKTICQTLIKRFEESDLKTEGVLYGPNGLSSSDGKKSTDISFNPSFLENDIWRDLLTPVVDLVYKNLYTYIRYNDVALNSIDPLDLSSVFNMQRYLPGEGFFNYHCESSTNNPKYLSRVLVWMIYLNDVSDGGETEFYYQRRFEKPEEGKLLIWPADWTHLHRGHTSDTQTKYILTGWINYKNN